MAKTNAEKTKEELARLDKSIRFANRVVVAWMAAWAIFYFIWFAVNRGAKPPVTAASWGVMGDFFGGFMNPVVAYFAFYWLTRSVRLQKEELAETRDALQGSANAQDRQVELASINVRLNALGTLVDSIMSEVSIQRTLLQFYIDQMSKPVFYDVQGNRVPQQSHIVTLIASINDAITKLMLKRMDYQARIEELLKEQEDLAAPQ